VLLTILAGFTVYIYFFPNNLGHPDNYIEANPSVTLSQDEINQIMYLLQKFVYDNKDNLFLLDIFLFYSIVNNAMTLLL
jgi:hypothetical protein